MTCRLWLCRAVQRPACTEREIKRSLPELEPRRVVHVIRCYHIKLTASTRPGTERRPDVDVLVGDWIVLQA